MKYQNVFTSIVMLSIAFPPSVVVDAREILPTPPPISLPTAAPTGLSTFSRPPPPVRTSAPQSPTSTPSKRPTTSPSKEPSKFPSLSPQSTPTNPPTIKVTGAFKTKQPTSYPTTSPSSSPTKSPSIGPTAGPSQSPSEGPTIAPSKSPTNTPSQSPIVSPTHAPSEGPTNSPSQGPSVSPTQGPSQGPSVSPTNAPSVPPTASPTKPPTSSPTSHPTIDVNECSDNTHSCDANAECTNTQGSYTCECKSGYTGDGFECTNIDECATETANDCDERAQCSDTEGGYTCECPDGWIGDGKVCETASPTSSPSVAPSRGPSQGPTASPTLSPTSSPSKSPSRVPSQSPSSSPSREPSRSPSSSPSRSSQSPSSSPSREPSQSPSFKPTSSPVILNPNDPNVNITLVISGQITLDNVDSISPHEGELTSDMEEVLVDTFSCPTDDPNIQECTATVTSLESLVADHGFKDDHPTTTRGLLRHLRNKNRRRLDHLYVANYEMNLHIIVPAYETNPGGVAYNDPDRLRGVANAAYNIATQGVQTAVQGGTLIEMMLEHSSVELGALLANAQASGTFVEFNDDSFSTVIVSVDTSSPTQSPTRSPSSSPSLSPTAVQTKQPNNGQPSTGPFKDITKPIPPGKGGPNPGKGGGQGRDKENNPPKGQPSVNEEMDTNTMTDPPPVDPAQETFKPNQPVQTEESTHVPPGQTKSTDVPPGEETNGKSKGKHLHDRAKHICNDYTVILAGINVKLYDGLGNLVAMAKTDSEGFYTFEGLEESERFAVSIDYPNCN